MLSISFWCEFFIYITFNFDNCTKQKDYLPPESKLFNFLSLCITDWLLGLIRVSCLIKDKKIRLKKKKKYLVIFIYMYIPLKNYSLSLSLSMIVTYNLKYFKHAILVYKGIGNNTSPKCFDKIKLCNSKLSVQIYTCIK